MASMIEKQHWLLDTIRRHRKISFEELSGLWMKNSNFNPDSNPLNYRTFNRYVNSIKDIYGVSIECDRHTNEFYISNEVAVNDGTMKDWLLDTIAADNIVRECKSISDRILFETIPNGREHLYTIAQALKGNQVLEVTYRTFWKAESYVTQIEPYFLKVYKQRWYLIGISDRHPGELRVFGLDRMEKVDITDKHFKYPCDFSPKVYCSNSFGIFLSDKKPEVVKIKVTENQQSFVRSLPLHCSQEEIETTPEYSIFQYYLAPEYDFEQELLSRAATVEVLEPEWLRDEMKSIILKMFSNYQ